MRNIVNINLTSSPIEYGYTNEGNSPNEVQLNILVSNLVNPYLEITKQDGTIENTEVLVPRNNEISYILQTSYVYTLGSLLLRVRSEEYDSEYITFSIPNTLTSEDDIFIKKENDCFVIKKLTNYKYYDMPIATPTSLGGIIVGDNLEINSQGVLSSTGGGTSTVESLTNTEIESLINSIIL